MIRPLTILTCLLACGSGLYLYQSKHEVQLLDRTIERTVHETNALREQSRLLAAEWTMLNDPERLRQFSDTYLKLKSIAPSQFTSLGDLDTRLPAQQAEVAPPTSGEPAMVAGTGDAGLLAMPEPAAIADADEVLPVPPIPAPPVVAATARPADAKPPERRPVLADSLAHPIAVVDVRPIEQHAAARVADARAEARVPVAALPHPIVLAVPRPMPASVAVMPAPYHPLVVATGSGVAATRPASALPNGSLLGIARGSMPPAPRPIPVSATYNPN